MDITEVAPKWVVLKSESYDTTAGGVVLAQEGGKRPQKPEVGIVFKIGTGKRPVEFKVGSKVVFEKYTDNRIQIAGVEYNFVKFEHIIALLK